MKINKFLAAVAGTMLCFTSCVKDLETLPLNEWDVTSETAYGADEAGYLQGLAKLYNSISTHELYDISGVDKGATSAIRALWACQEVTTDACKIAWGNDAWVRAMNTNTWSDAENEAVYGVFFRSLQSISWVNEYLRQTEDSKLSDRGVADDVKAKIQGFRAEARFVRAFFYWMAMDTFGAVPFSTENSEFGAKAPAQVPAAEIYAFVVSELEELAQILPDAQSNYPRADKGSALGLLARVYLNAEIYAGVKAYDKVIATCEKIFSLGYGLADNYADLFRGDNGTNPEVMKEFLFAVAYDSEFQQSYGGTSFLTLAAIASTDVSTFPNGVKGGWGGIRCTKDFVTKYFYVDAASAVLNGGTYVEPEDEYPAVEDDPDTEDVDESVPALYTAYKLIGADDDRAKLFATGFGNRASLEVTDEEKLYLFEHGWQCLKFSNIPHNMTAAEFATTAANEAFADIDFPVIRLADVYMMYAEACVREGQASKAQPYLNQVITRSNGVAHTLASTWTTEERDWFIAERARELLWECSRRTDLIRYGVYCSNELLWPFKGGTSQAGQEFPEYKKLFAIPASQIVANPELKNPVGY